MASDDFNRANSGSLGANWTALAGTWTINSNAAEVTDDDGPTGYYARRDAEGDLGSADHWSEVVPVGTQTDGASNCGPAVRHRSGATTGYQFVTKFSDSCEFWRVVAGSEQGPLATFTAAVNSGDTCRLEAVGRTFRFKVNGTIVNVLQDTNIADGQRPAMNGYNGNSSDLVRVDSWAGNLMTTLTAPYVVDWSAQVTGTGTTLTPTIPVTPAAGDLVLVQTTSRDAAQTMTAPGSEGWSSIQAPSQTGLEDVLWGKIWGLGATDDTTPTFSIGSGTAGWGVTAVIIRNPSHATAPWTSVASAVVASGSQSNAAAATVTCPSVSHTGNSRTVVRVGSSADDNALNAPNQGFLWYGGATYDSTTGNDFSQAMSVAEDIAVTTNTSTSTFAESVNGNDVSNGITLVLAIPTSTNGTATPAVIAATTTLPAPSVVGVSSAQPAAIAGATTLPAPSPSGAATASPTAIGAPVALPAPSALGQSTAQPAVIVSAATVSSPGVSAAAGPAAIASAAILPAPSATGAATATPATIAAVVTIPAASAEAPATVQPATIVAAVSLPAPTVAVSATASPADVEILTDLPTPGLSTGVTPGTIAAVASVPTPSVSAGGSVSVTPSTIQAIVSVLTPGISTGAGPGAVAATTSLPAPTVTGGTGATATPQTIAALVTLPAPTVTGQTHGTATPTTIALVVLLPQATATGGSGPELVGRVVSISRASATVTATSGARPSIDQEVTTS